MIYEMLYKATVGFGDTKYHSRLSVTGMFDVLYIKVFGEKYQSVKSVRSLGA